MSASRPQTLAEDLRARDDEALAALLRARPDLLSPVPSDLTSLAARATTRPSVQRALDLLNRFTLQVLEVLCVVPEPAEESSVRAALGADPAVALANLREQALVYSDDADRLYVPRTVRDVVGSPAGLGPPVELALQPYGPRRAGQLTADLGGPAHVVLGDSSRLAGLLADASPAAREALEVLAWGPPTGRLENATREVAAATAATPVEWLLAHGLLVAADSRTVVLPREVGLHLRGGVVHGQVQP
nr:DNA-binding protein [Sporichthyaceae bacterium]